MSRLYDRLLRYGLRPAVEHIPEITAKDNERLRAGVPVVLANNVTEYFYAGTPQEDWRYERDIPNLAPPFDRFFLETRHPSRILTPDGLYPWPADAPEAWALFVQADDYRKELGDDEWREGSRRSLSYLCERLPSDQHGERYFKGYPAEPARWLSHSSIYYELSGEKPAGPVALHFAALREDGVPCRTDRGEQMVWAMPMTSDLVEQRFLGQELGTMILPLWLAVSFTHCKNVALDENEPPQKPSRKHRRKHGRPLTNYYTLEIGAMTEVLEREGGVSETGLKRALHICRGHFATYSPDKPLFGKYSGTFWKPQHVRGNKKHGEVIKDYAVKAPE